jgi:VanZ family protein
MILSFLISWGPATLWAAVLFFLSSKPAMPGGLEIPIPDKILHLGAYFVLGAALAWAGREKKDRWVHWTLIFVGVAFAFSDEWHQSFVPGRDPSGWDVVADVVGVVGGYVRVRRFLHSRTNPAATTL